MKTSIAKKLLLLSLLAIPAWAQQSPVLAGAVTAGAPCTQGSPFYANLATGIMASCQYNGTIWVWTPGGGGTGQPGGSPGQIQYNNAGSFGGITLVPIVNGGTGTASPGLIAGTNIGVTGSWPNQTISSTGGGKAASHVVTFSATPTYTCTSATTGTVEDFTLSTALSANVTSSTLSTCTTGQTLNFTYTQASVGGPYTNAMPANFDACPVSPTAGAVTTCGYWYDGVNGHLIGVESTDVPSVLLLSSTRAAPTVVPSGGAVWPDSTDNDLEYRQTGGGSIFKMFLSGGDANPVTGVVSKINTVAFPTSATVIGSNASAQPVAAPLQGNGSKVQLSTGSIVNGDLVQADANGNTVDSNILAANVVTSSNGGSSVKFGALNPATLCSPIDTSCFSLTEEFAGSAVTTNAVGSLGWTFHNIGSGTCVGSNVTGSLPNLGIFQAQGGSTGGFGCSFALDGASGIGIFGNMQTMPNWDSYFIWALGTATTTEQARVGYITPATLTAFPVAGLYSRYDTELKNVSSATCNDAGNKCGLTTLTCSVSQTVLFKINGGTATGSVACTGTNAIANTTAITVTAAGAGYNSTGGAAVGTTTGGTATFTGTVALTTTLGAAESGADTDYWLCSTLVSLESCADTTVAATTTFHKVRIRWINSTTIGMSFFTGAGAIVGSEVTFCPGGGCTVTVTNPLNLAPVFMNVTATSASRLVQADYFGIQVTGVVR